jgi:hypothetical protein
MYHAKKRDNSDYGLFWCYHVRNKGSEIHSDTFLILQVDTLRSLQSSLQPLSLGFTSPIEAINSPSIGSLPTATTFPDDFGDLREMFCGQTEMNFFSKLMIAILYFKLYNSNFPQARCFGGRNTSICNNKMSSADHHVT